MLVPLLFLVAVFVVAIVYMDPTDRPDCGVAVILFAAIHLLAFLPVLLIPGWSAERSLSILLPFWGIVTMTAFLIWLGDRL